MSNKYFSDSANARIELLLECGVPPKKIVEDEKISLSIIYAKRARLKAFGTVNPSSLSVQGRSRALLREQEAAIEDFLEEYPYAYLDEIIAFISNEFDVEVARNTMSRAIGRIKLIYKRVEPVHGAQNEILDIRWMSTISTYTV